MFQRETMPRPKLYDSPAERQAAYRARHADKAPPDDLKTGFDAVKIDDAKRVLTYLATQ